MTDPWTPVLSKLALSRAEQAAVRRFGQDPEGRSFLPVADILRAHNKHDESLELLTQGVERHPSFSVARVVLARELLNRGMVALAWTTLDESAQALDDNILAQKLKLKLSILISREDLASEILNHLRTHQMLDESSTKIGEIFTHSGLEKAKDSLFVELKSKGISLIIPDATDFSRETEQTRTQQQSAASDEDFSGESAEKTVIDESISGFNVMPLDEIFQGAGTDMETGQVGVELDSTTLADLYCRQGHFSKAMAIYKRLLRMTPNSDYLRRKIKEVGGLDREQRSNDISVDPAVVDQMETLEIIDSQRNLFLELLRRLEHRHEG